MGKRTIAVERLEKEMKQRETDKTVLKARFDQLQQKINEEAAYDYNSETVLRNLREFRNVFGELTPQEKTETMRCLLKQINALPGKLVLEVYELADFKRGSQNHPDWLSDMDSNHE
jgi:CII-binding regulator of phage lambda lysogenization HflD